MIFKQQLRAAPGPSPRPAGRAETHEKRPQRPYQKYKHGSEVSQSGEKDRPELCAKPPGQSLADPTCLDWQCHETLVGLCIGRLSAAVETGCAHCLSEFAVSRWDEVLPVTAAKAGKALGPMLLTSARELWRLFVLRDRVSRRPPGSAIFAEIGLRMLDWRLSPTVRPLVFVTTSCCVDAAHDGGMLRGRAVSSVRSS